MEIGSVTGTSNQDGTIRPGRVSGEILVGGQEADGLSFHLAYTRYNSGEDTFSSPRHRHRFQQVRWALEGEFNYAPGKDIPPGDVGYFPRGAYYGPQRMDAGQHMLMQLGLDGEHLGGRDAIRLAHESLARLVAQGARIENGSLIDTDPETGTRRERDTVNAAYEALAPAKPIPAEGYAQPIIMHPGAFAYYEEAPGVAVKHLGRFYDHPGPDGDLHLSVVHLTPGATYTLGPERAQAGWVQTAGLLINGSPCPALTAFYSRHGELAELGASEAAEANVVEFPRPS